MANQNWRYPATFAVGVVAGASAFGGVALAHDINSPEVLVAAEPWCLKLNSEIDHNGNDGMRTWSELRNDKIQAGLTNCGQWDDNRYSRIKRAMYAQPIGGGAFALCRIGVGDGLGDPNYYHKTDDNWGVNGPWYSSAPCGWSNYHTYTWGDELDNGWQGSGGASIPTENYHEWK